MEYQLVGSRFGMFRLFSNFAVIYLDRFARCPHAQTATVLCFRCCSVSQAIRVQPPHPHPSSHCHRSTDPHSIFELQHFLHAKHYDGSTYHHTKHPVVCTVTIIRRCTPSSYFPVTRACHCCVCCTASRVDSATSSEPTSTTQAEDTPAGKGPLETG